MAGSIRSLGFEIEFIDSHRSPATTCAMVLKVEQAPKPPGGLLKMHTAGPHPQSFLLFRSGVGPNNLRF